MAPAPQRSLNRLTTLLALLLALVSVSAALNPSPLPPLTGPDAEVDWVVQLDAGADVPAFTAAVRSRLGVAAHRILDDVYLVPHPWSVAGSPVEGWAKPVLESLPHVRDATLHPATAPGMVHRDTLSVPRAGDPAINAVLSSIKDARFGEQWHLTQNISNTHINVLPVWAQNITGQGIVVQVADDGVDFTNRDLAEAYIPELSYDYVTNTPEPRPRGTQAHGTKAAGLVLARRNNFCGVGVAPSAKLVGARILNNERDTAPADPREAAALSAYIDKVHVYSNSYGLMSYLRPLLSKALAENVRKGRGGKGSIYMFAAGNGRLEYDNCAFDGYVSSIYTIAVSAIHMGNKAADYAEECPSILVSTYSSYNYMDDVTAMTTTSTGVDGCTATFGGTSAATPIAAGIVALILQVRPDLGWRDVMSLLVHHATPIDTNDPSWQRTYGDLMYSPRYGFGKLDAAKLVEVARTFKKIPATMSEYHSPTVDVNRPIPAGTKIASTLTVPASAGVARIEQVQVSVNVSSTALGYLVYTLRSPSGAASRLTSVRYHDDKTKLTNWFTWNFTTVRFWDEEQVAGDWTLEIIDANTTHFGNWASWSIHLYGVSRKDMDALSAEGAKNTTSRAAPGAAATSNLAMVGSWITAAVIALLMTLA
ncbi:pheromone processing endoprotease [Blastocladiella emersonii ATCC 22665]|nr:pheromone processing endoprotease [Blastocladiella emersonii ATCC 22665]